MQDIVEQINAHLKDGDLLAVRKLLVQPMGTIIAGVFSRNIAVTRAFIVKEYQPLIPIIELYPSIATAACAFSNCVENNDVVNTPEFDVLCMLYIAYADPDIAFEHHIYDSEFINYKAIKSNFFWQYFWAHMPLPQRLKLIDSTYKFPIGCMLAFILQNNPFDLTFFKAISRKIRKEAPNYYELLRVTPLKLCIKKLRIRHEAANK